MSETLKLLSVRVLLTMLAGLLVMVSIEERDTWLGRSSEPVKRRPGLFN
ncbi:MAG: hypothetical protein E6700_09465 [Winkia neuii]|nr:hypothetical protein [Winkia neuii]MDK8099670.1 hypothetical protein [Winkia neuii]MDU3135782.1 hypothetical protein [Winkia neuii]